MKKNAKFVSFLLDETGSMYPIKDDTIGGFNAYVETLRKDGADIAFSLVTFNSNTTQRRYVAEPINKIGPLTEANYEPDAATPLIDASVKIINATDEAVKLRNDDPTVLVVIQTDGEENCSVEHTVADLALLVKERLPPGGSSCSLALDSTHSRPLATLGCISIRGTRSLTTNIPREQCSSKQHRTIVNF